MLAGSCRAAISSRNPTSVQTWPSVPNLLPAWLPAAEAVACCIRRAGKRSIMRSGRKNHQRAAESFAIASTLRSCGTEERPSVTIRSPLKSLYTFTNNHSGRKPYLTWRGTAWRRLLLELLQLLPHCHELLFHGLGSPGNP